MNIMKNFFTNSFVHAVIVFLVMVGGYALSSGGEWQTITLGTLAAGILSFLKGKALLGK